MKTWKAYFVIFGDGYNAYPQVEFEIDDALYNRIQEAVNSLKPLKKCDFYQKLLDLADEAPLDPHEYLPMLDDEPERDEYDDDDEFQEAMEEYNEYVEDMMNEVSFEKCIIDDPGDRLRFEKKIIGVQFPAWAGQEWVQEEYEDDDCVYKYTVYLSVDEDGVVNSVKSIEAEGLESEGLSSSSSSGVYPDYEFIYDMLMEEQERQNEEEE